MLKLIIFFFNETKKQSWMIWRENKKDINEPFVIMNKIKSFQMNSAGHMLLLLWFSSCLSAQK